MREIGAENSGKRIVVLEIGDSPTHTGSGRKRQPLDQDLAELERRVLIAELRAREAEAELRILEAIAKRKGLRSGKRDRKTKSRPAG